MMTIAEAQIEAADTAARAAAAGAGVRIRELAELPDLAAACALFDKIWQPGPGGQSPLHAELLRALTKAGKQLRVRRVRRRDGRPHRRVHGVLRAAGGGVAAQPHRGGPRRTGIAPRGGLRAEGSPAGLVPAPRVRSMHWTFDPLIRRPERLFQHGQARCPASRVL